MNARNNTLGTLSSAGLAMLVSCGLSAYGAAARAVTADNVVCSGCINTSDIAAGAVTGAKIANNTITGNQIASEALTHNDILDEPGIDFINQSGTGYSSSLAPTTWITQQQITITHQAPGFVYCTAQGTLDWQVQYVSNPPFGQVGWTNSSSAAPEGYASARPTESTAAGPEMPVSTMRTFLVTGSGSKTFYLKARLVNGVNGAVAYHRQGAACMYFPTQL